ATVGDTSSVHNDVHTTEHSVGRCHHRSRLGEVGEVSLDVLGTAFWGLELGRDRLATLGVATADDEAGRPALGEQLRDGFPESLRGSGHDGDLAVKLPRPVIQYVHAPALSSASARERLT